MFYIRAVTCVVLATSIYLLLAAYAAMAQSVDTTQVAAMASFENVVDMVSNPADAKPLNAVLVQGGFSGGPGGLFADLTGDGFPEIYLMRGDPNNNGTHSENQLYLNLPDGKGGRVFVQAINANADHPGDSVGAVAADYDNDGDLDLYVVNYNQPNVLLKNLLVEKNALGNPLELEFVDVTAEAGVGAVLFATGIAECPTVLLDNSMTAVWADVNRDGWIDLYVGSHNGALNTNEPFDCPGPGQRDTLYLNQGDGTFIDVTMQFGVTGYETAEGEPVSPCGQWYASTVGVTFRDLNNDLWPDLIVSNITHDVCDRDMLYINRGVDKQGVWLGFDQIAYVVGFGDQSPRAMGVDAGDIDNDGDVDIYITDTAVFENDLWLNQLTETGSLGFTRSGDLAGVTTWGAQFADFDNNGRLDVHNATRSGDRDQLYLNTSTGFIEVAAQAGVDQAANSRGDHASDFDGDGWIDLLVVNRGGVAVAVFQNQSSTQNPNHDSITIRVLGDPDTPSLLRSTRDAIGTRIEVAADLDGDAIVEINEVQRREIVSGESNAAGMSSLAQVIGVGFAQSVVVRVSWLSGQSMTFLTTRGAQITVDEKELLISDLNIDGNVDATDLASLLSSWGPCALPGAPCLGDVTGDGVVDSADLASLLGSWSGS